MQTWMASKWPCWFFEICPKYIVQVLKQRLVLKSLHANTRISMNYFAKQKKLKISSRNETSPHLQHKLTSMRLQLIIKKYSVSSLDMKDISLKIANHSHNSNRTLNIRHHNGCFILWKRKSSRCWFSDLDKDNWSFETKVRSLFTE